MRKDQSPSDVLVNMEKRGSMVTVPFGFQPLDDLVGGMGIGEVCVVGARTSRGKSAFALNVLASLAESGRQVGLISLEMSAEAVVYRLMCRYTGIPIKRLRINDLTDTEAILLVDVKDRLSHMPIIFNDTTSLTCTQIQDKLRDWVKDGVECVAIDYIQFIRSDKENKVQAVAEAARAMQDIARETEMPLLVPAQLNRGAEFRSDGPRLYDLKDSGAIEESTDLCILLHHTVEPQVDMIVAKNRNGPTGVVSGVFDKTRLDFISRKEYYERTGEQLRDGGESTGYLGGSPGRADGAGRCEYSGLPLRVS